MSAWDDVQYLKFADERTRPASELLARVPLSAAEHVVDLGCGPGNSTALLAARWPQARLTGVDTSPEMLARARQDYPERIQWLQSDLRDFHHDGSLDLLFANAVMQWLPDHANLFPALLAQLRPGGVLALQMPCNFAEPSHRLMRELPGPWAEATANVHARTPVENANFYYDVLASDSQSLDIWQTTYQHVMSDAQAIVEWLKATGLRPYLDAVPEADRAAYLTAYRDALAQAYPLRADGKRLFAFPRLFIVAVRAPR
jgi:trans-aconitate 2-methyltransferase